MMNESQLVWRCRRGVRELDVLFGRFLESDYPTLSSEEQLVFQQLLEVQEPVFMDWLFDKYAPEETEMFVLIRRLQTLSGLNKP